MGCVQAAGQLRSLTSDLRRLGTDLYFLGAKDSTICLEPDCVNSEDKVVLSCKLMLSMFWVVSMVLLVLKAFTLVMFHKILRRIFSLSH